MEPETLDAVEQTVESLRRKPRGNSGAALPATGPGGGGVALKTDIGDLKEEVEIDEGRLDQIVNFDNGTSQIDGCSRTTDISDIEHISKNAKSDVILNDFDLKSSPQLTIIKDDRDEEILEEKSSPSLNLSFSNNVGQLVSNSITQSEDMVAIDLKRYLKNSEAYNFYCPNCNCCMDKVILRKREQEIAPSEPIDIFRCMSCFSFLILAGRQFVSLFAPANNDADTIGHGISPKQLPLDDHTKSKPKMENEEMVTESKLFSGQSQSIFPSQTMDSLSIGVSTKPPEYEKDVKTMLTQGPGELKQVVIKIQGTPEDAVERNIDVEAAAEVLDASLEATNLEIRDGIGLDVLKSIVYGGLIETITSLGIVTSAVAANAGTVNILALGLANLIGGLLVLGHYIWDLKTDGFRLAPNQTNIEIDQYQEVLGHRRYFPLHSIVAVFSFLVFGMVPILTYAFSFRESEMTELKLAIAMGASVICIIVLAAGKAHIKKPRRLGKYVKTIVYYVFAGVVVSGASYILGTLFMKLAEKFRWFKASQYLAEVIAHDNLEMIT